MKARKTIGAILAIIGIFAAVSVEDGSAHEMFIRIGGMVMIFVGAWMANLFDTKNA